MADLELRFPLGRLPPAAETLRGEVRAFIDELRADGTLPRPRRAGLGFSREVSRRLGARGWIGLTWPKRYGGGERSALERYVITEELLAASVPVGAHWIADRQSGPVLLRFGTEAQRERYLPPITRGELFFCIGLSEPDSGSDLASLRTRAERVPGGWRLNGRKIWTTNAHRVSHMIVLTRTGRDEKDRHAGLSQFILDLSSPGVSISPIISMVGEHDFNEVAFDDVHLPEDSLVGTEGGGWGQVSAELAHERSGPERWLSTFRLLAELIEVLGGDGGDLAAQEIGRLMSHLLALRQLSLSVAGMLEAGSAPAVEAAIVKDVGTRFEQEVVRVVRNVMLSEGLSQAAQAETLRALHASCLLLSPAFTIRGGTTEIVRGIIARGLGLR